MKVLFVINSLAGGGAQRVLYNLLSQMLRQDGGEYSVLILSNIQDKYSESLKQLGINIYEVPKDCKSHLQKILYIKNFCINSNADIIHANLFPTIYYCSLAKRLGGKDFPKLCITEHNTHNRRRQYSILRYVEKYIYDMYDCVISISSRTQESLLEWIHPNSTDKYVMIPNGIDLNLFFQGKPYDRHVLFYAWSDHLQSKKTIILC